MSIKCVIFDIGGVLLRSKEPAWWYRWEQELKLPQDQLPILLFDSEVARQAMLGRASAWDMFEHLARSLGLNEDQLNQLVEDLRSGTYVDASLVEFLNELRPDYKTALLSDAWPDARELFTLYGLHQAAYQMVISAEEGLAKPDKRLFRLALERLGVLPEETVFVDDLSQNVHGAREIGIRAIQFESPEQVISEVNSLLESEL
jgi:epoxide hydrolase-like predicted phosphatase